MPKTSPTLINRELDSCLYVLADSNISNYGYHGDRLNIATHTFTYSATEISEKIADEENRGPSSFTYSLSNGLITSRTYSNNKYSYNKDFLYEVSDGDLKARYTWDGGDITCVTTTYDNIEEKAIYKYTERYDYGHICNHVYGYFAGDFASELAMQGFFGRTPLHLIKEISELGGNGVTLMTLSFSYEFDADGYPLSVTIYENGKEFLTYNFTWTTVR